MPSVVGKITKGAVFDGVVGAEDVGEFDSMDEKVTPVDADLLIVADSAASYARKKVQIGSLSKITGDGVNKITVSASEPSSPTTGDLWIDIS